MTNAPTSCTARNGSTAAPTATPVPDASAAPADSETPLRTPQTPSAAARTALEAARRRTLSLTDPVTDMDLTAQRSRLMSPLVWDLAHIANQEDLWLVRTAGRRPGVRRDHGRSARGRTSPTCRFAAPPRWGSPRSSAAESGEQPAPTGPQVHYRSSSGALSVVA
ncbi:hypothetical protein G5C60_16550 [Streptomyces sp. HC44]|uniref:DinB-like domain-containing protein n=1 Tax=Streptomyces scabichelini TaxID=2711217 RepID=A0A6G4V5H0_9ACTN|nr:hypothetical protein [Streptomyces scabichelini]